MKKHLGLALATLLLLATPAYADGDLQKIKRPEFVPKGGGTWAELVGPTPAQWFPQGTLIADSKFRPWPDGFAFYNYGNDASTLSNQMNNYLFGSRAKPWNLDGDALRDLVGKKVCVGNNAKGRCVPTVAAKRWLQSANASMAGGHCWGIATTAALLYNNELKIKQFSKKVRMPQALRFEEDLSREIARQFATQLVADMSAFAVSPTEAVEMLKQAFATGKTTYSLAISTTSGEGHGITPYAVYDRGNGFYDIAVYDNNYPGRERAVHVDTNTDTYEYLMMTQPGEGPLYATVNMALAPVSELAKKQQCPFCLGATEATVQLKPVTSKVRIDARITDPDGKPIPGLEEIPPTSPWRPGQKWTFPTFIVPKGQAFVVTVSAEQARSRFTTGVQLSSGQYGYTLKGVSVPRGGEGTATWQPNGTVLMSPGLRTDKRVEINDNDPGQSQAIQGRLVKGPARDVSARLYDRKDRIKFWAENGKAGKVRLEGLYYFANAKEQTVVAVAELRTALPRKGSVTVDMSSWTQKKPRALKAIVKQPGGKDRRVAFKVKLRTLSN